MNDKDTTKVWNDTATFGKCEHCKVVFKFSPSAKRRFCSVKCSDLNRPTGNKAQHWLGNKVLYGGLHQWVYKTLGQPDKCELCGKKGLSGCKIHWANVSGKYVRNPKDWKRLCASCHKRFDMTPKMKLELRHRLEVYRYNNIYAER